MTAQPELRIVDREPTVEDELRALLRARERVGRQRAKIDAEMQPLRRRYADARGETMLPTVERLQRELLG